MPADDGRDRAAPKPLRVLHIIKTLGLGGAETNLLNLVQAFAPQRIETHVAYSYGGEIEPRFRAAGVRLFKYAEQSHRIKSAQSILIVLRLAAYIRRARIDIVQTHNFNGHVWGLLAAKLAGARLVEHVHDFRYVPAADLARRHGLLDQYRYVRWFKRRSDRVVVLTKQNAAYVVDHAIADASQVAEIQNGIAVDDAHDAHDPHDATMQRAASRARHDIAADAFVVLTSARMDPSKNIDLILDIAAAVAAVVPTVQFLIAGSGTHLDTYRQRCTALGLDRHVRFLGFQQDVDALLALCDVFLLPSFLELHSIAILEALRRRVPVVVSRDVGCNDAFIDDGVNGYLCDPFSREPWIAALTALGRDPALREAVGQRGFATCRALFDLPPTARRFEKLYTDLMESGR